MNRFLSMLIVLLFCLVSSGMVYGQSKKVVFLRYRIPVSHFSTVVDGFKKTMTQRGFIEGEHVDYIDVLTRSANKTSVPDVMAAVEEWQDRADMIITSGWVTLYARSKLKESSTPQLFVPTLKSVALEMLDSMTSPPGTNISGIYLMYPPEKILRLTRLLLPGLTNYCYVYDSRIPADMIFKSAYEELTPAKRYGVTIHFLDLSSGVEQVLQDMKTKKIEAFGGIVGSFQKRKELAASGLPVITAFTLDIEQDKLKEYVKEGNMVAGLFNPFRYCGEQAAEMTADIFSGKRSIEESTPRPARQIAFINLETARRIDLHVPFAALESVDIIIK
jgi:ABC-type uncharacterized transport system substrate-binding protein